MVPISNIENQNNTKTKTSLQTWAPAGVRCGRVDAWAVVRARQSVGVTVRACRGVGMGAVVSSRVYVSVFARVRGCGRTGVLVSVCWEVETLYFLICLFSCSYLFDFHCINTRHTTPQFTLITTNHDRIPSQPYGVCSDVFLTVPGPGSRVDTDVDVEV